MLANLGRRVLGYALSALCALIIAAIAFTLHRSYVAQTLRISTNNNESQPKTLDPRPPALNIESITPYGHIVEIVAETAPGATVMVNGQRAAVIFPGARIRHFVGPLPDGITVITITAQNDGGGVNTKRLAVELP
ncbi:MAG: hypothetical protein ACM3WP_12465 [Acidobacteriota bacterium]